MERNRSIALLFPFAAVAAACTPQTVEPTPCTTVAECDDGDDCTEDFCVSMECQREVVQTPECIPDYGCEIDQDCEDDDPCTEDVCAAGECFNEPIEDCGADGPLSGIVDLDVGSDDQGRPFGNYSPDTVYEEWLEAQEAGEEIPTGTCAEYLYTNPTGAQLASMGDLEIERDGELLATITPDPYFRYDGYTAPFPVAVGDVLDLIVTGSPPGTSASTIPGAFHVFDRPAFSNLTFTTDTIDGTFSYTPVPADRLFLTFQYFTTEPKILRCRLDPEAGTFVMPAADYAALGASGSVQAEAKRVQRGAIDAEDQERALLLTTTRRTSQGSYDKEKR